MTWEIDQVKTTVQIKKNCNSCCLVPLLAQKNFLPSLVTLLRQGWCCHLKPVTVTQICKTGCYLLAMALGDCVISDEEPLPYRCGSNHRHRFSGWICMAFGCQVLCFRAFWFYGFSISLSLKCSFSSALFDFNKNYMLFDLKECLDIAIP